MDSAPFGHSACLMVTEGIMTIRIQSHLCCCWSHFTLVEDPLTSTNVVCISLLHVGKFVSESSKVSGF